MPAQHATDNVQPLAFSEPIPLDADAVDLVDLFDAVEARNAARREAAS